MERTLKEYMEAMVYGKVYITKGRRQIWYNHNKYAYARAVWWMNNPNDTLTMKDEIHHKDFDRLNDEASNLEKLSVIEHRLIHKNYKRT